MNGAAAVPERSINRAKIRRTVMTGMSHHFLLAQTNASHSDR
jgi:hypothetical protein